ncbi:STE family protein kinase [Histomonas meleagridis]|uniref:STE family protein kinase n=1 Tax=Histomonas meleagridis TaxID=135588 RepID=UPI00355A1700|nr:STE family protein kinase [Histomonas meleagridis]KAH0799147.1 STE family protein kinase [Histomonas meleagridis]
MLGKLFQPKPRISEPLQITHQVHIDKELNWTFDKSVNPREIFTVLKVIGKGGFGTVSQIVHRPSMKILAGKLINPTLVDESSKSELQHEIELMREVRSNYTVQYYGSVPYDNSLMILMEYCDLGSFRDILDRNEQVLSEDQISLVIHDLLKGLELIHTKHRIVHRDIKSANILLTSEGEIRIADFGVSRRFEASGTCHTMTIVGTPYWMAPEVISGILYSFSADIWSVGITAIELAEGAPPYVEYSPTKAMIEIAIKGFPGYRFPAMHSTEFCDFVSHCLEMNPNDRWSIPQLLEHPFIKRAERMDRKEVLRNFLTPTSPMNSFSHQMNDANIETDGSTFSFSDSSLMLQDSVDLTSARLIQSDFSNLSEDNSKLSILAGNNRLPSGKDLTLDSVYSFEGTAMMVMNNEMDSLASFRPPFAMQTDDESSQMLQSGSYYGDEFDSLNLSSSSPFLQMSPDDGDSLSFNNLQSSNQFDSMSEFLDRKDEVKDKDKQTADSQKVGKGPMDVPEKVQKPKSTKTVSFAEPPLPPTSGARTSKRLPQLHGQTKQPAQQRPRVGTSAPQQGSSSAKFPRMLEPTKVQTTGHALATQGQLSDKVFIKVARIVSAKIPFIPLKVGINNDAELETLYQKKVMDSVVDKKNVFNQNGAINLSGALRSKKAATTVSFFILFVLMTFIRFDEFVAIITICFVASLITMYLRKERKKKREQENKDN